MGSRLRGRGQAQLAFVVLSVTVCAVAALSGAALSRGRTASAQAPGDAFLLLPDTAVGTGEQTLSPPDLIIQPLAGPPPPPPPPPVVTVGVIHPPCPEYQGEPAPGSKPALCPLLKPPHPPGYPTVHDEGTMLLAEGAPLGGTYQWDFDGKTGEEAWFECDTLTGEPLEDLRHQQSVTYTVENVGDAEADSGYIRVFNAELTFEGGLASPQDTVEDAPGFFMAVGPERRPAALALSPSDPDDVMPSEGPQAFDEGMSPRYGPTPYQVILSASGPISIYEDAEGGEPLTGDDLVWGWKEGLYGQQFEVATPGQLYVEATDAGSAEITLTLSISCPIECMDWYAAPASGEDTVKITVLELLEAQDLDGWVSTEAEDDPGAFVHYNVDNDNASDNAQGAPKHPGGDYLEDDFFVGGENDLALVRMCVGATTPTEGAMKLARGGAMRVWKKPYKGPAHAVLVALAQKEWDLSDQNDRDEFNALKSTLYVEGCAGSADTLTLTYAPPGDQPVISDTIHYTFIAADCGDQPRTDAVPTKLWNVLTGQWETGLRSQKGHIRQDCPNLWDCEWSVTAQFDQHDGYHWALKGYNCIAWSVDETDNVYTTEDIARDYGNKNGFFEHDDMDDFYAQKKGWSRIDVGTPAQKAAQAEAIYYEGFHAARRKSTCSCGAGRWGMYESKHGQYERIEHVWYQISGRAYGSALRFYK